MPILLFLVAIALSAMAVSCGLLPHPLSGTILVLKRGQFYASRGYLKPSARGYLQDIMRQAGVQNGFITLSGRAPAPIKVAFSRSIPPEVRQQLRNVLLN